MRCDADDMITIMYIFYFNPRTSCEVRRYIECPFCKEFVFQSTHLVWGATLTSESFDQTWQISIHAPRVRCDRIFLMKTTLYMYFNPRTSCEVRLDSVGAMIYDIFISIHAPRVRCDKNFSPMQTIRWQFQSTHLVWGATNAYIRPYGAVYISIHAPRVRCDK